jgi:hypothetical protein
MIANPVARLSASNIAALANGMRYVRFLAVNIIHVPLSFHVWIHGRGFPHPFGEAPQSYNRHSGSIYNLRVLRVST